MSEFNLKEKRKELLKKMFRKIKINTFTTPLYRGTLKSWVRKTLYGVEKLDEEFVKIVEAIIMDKRTTRREKIDKLHELIGVSEDG